MGLDLAPPPYVVHVQLGLHVSPQLVDQGLSQKLMLIKDRNLECMVWPTTISTVGGVCAPLQLVQTSYRHTVTLRDL